MTMKEQIKNLRDLWWRLDLVEGDIQDLVADSKELSTPENEAFKHRVLTLLKTYGEMRTDLANVLNMYDTFKTKYTELE